MNKNTFCLAPWFSLFVSANKEIRPCCRINKSTDYKLEQIDEYFASTELNALRDDLLNGIKNKQCEACWRDEQASGDSLRLITNRTIAMHNDISIKEQIQSPKVENIKSFDLTLGNLCNLKCRMCGPDLSSQLMAEATVNPDLQKYYPKSQSYRQSEYNWPKQGDFIDWCKRNLPNSIHIKFTGGEPFINPWIKDVIELMPLEQRKKCVLHFTSNLTVVDKHLFNMFKDFKEVWLSVSVEGIWATLDYIREGHSWTDLSLTIKMIKHMQIPNLKFKVNHVVQAPSFQSILPMARYFDGLGLSIHPIMLSHPKHFHISALTSGCKKRFINDAKRYDGLNKDFVDYVAKMCDLHMEQDHKLTHAMIRQLEDFDHVRKKDHKKIIPVDHIQDIV